MFSKCNNPYLPPLLPSSRFSRPPYLSIFFTSIFPALIKPDTNYESMGANIITHNNIGFIRCPQMSKNIFIILRTFKSSCQTCLSIYTRTILSVYPCEIRVNFQIRNITAQKYTTVRLIDSSQCFSAKLRLKSTIYPFLNK